MRLHTEHITYIIHYNTTISHWLDYLFCQVAVASTWLYSHCWNWLAEVCLELLGQAAYHESAMEFGRICWRCLQGGLGWRWLSGTSYPLFGHFCTIPWSVDGITHLDPLKISGDCRLAHQEGWRGAAGCTDKNALKWLRPSKRICFNISSPACKWSHMHNGILMHNAYHVQFDYIF